jgi:hypothetical protein
LTSSAALNPLPNKLGFDLSLPQPSSPEGKESKDAQAEGGPKALPLLEVPPRPKKTLEDAAASSLENTAPLPKPNTDASAAKSEDKSDGSDSPPSQPNVSHHVEPADSPRTTSSLSGSSTKATAVRTPSEWVGSSRIPSVVDDSVLTAIYKPESKEVWKKALQAANEQAERVCYHLFASTFLEPAH